MIRHIFIMLWNQKNKYTVLIIEQMLVFMAVSLSLAVIYDTVRSYNTPGRLNIDNVIDFGYMVSMVSGGAEKGARDGGGTGSDGYHKGKA